MHLPAPLSPPKWLDIAMNPSGFWFSAASYSALYTPSQKHVLADTVGRGGPIVAILVAIDRMQLHTDDSNSSASVACKHVRVTICLCFCLVVLPLTHFQQANVVASGVH
jgi:hypothetical protein